MAPGVPAPTRRPTPAELEALESGAPVRNAALPPNELHFRPARLWRRLLATLVDALVLGAVVLLYFYVASLVAGVKSEPTSAAGLDALVHRLQAWTPILVPGMVVAAVLGAVYAAVFALLLQGRSPGRFLTGTRLVDARGLPPRPARAVIRAALAVLSFAFLLAGFWWALIDRRGQTLHDKLTRTFVVQKA